VKIRLVTAMMITLVAASVCLGGPGNWMVIGKVISVTDDGVLVMCDSQGTLGKKKPDDGTVVFVYACTDCSDGDKVRFIGVTETGTYKYDSAGNAAKTVRAFEY
jgi:hypothetical protein